MNFGMITLNHSINGIPLNGFALKKIKTMLHGYKKLYYLY